jgi:hypothetical protein
VTRHGTIVGLSRSLTDIDRAAQLALAVHHRVAEWPSGRVAEWPSGRRLARSAPNLRHGPTIPRPQRPDADGIAFEPEPRTGRYGIDLAGWAEFEGVPEHVWWTCAT